MQIYIFNLVSNIHHSFCAVIGFFIIVMNNVGCHSTILRFILIHPLIYFLTSDRKMTTWSLL